MESKHERMLPKHEGECQIKGVHVWASNLQMEHVAIVEQTASMLRGIRLGITGCTIISINKVVSWLS